MFASCCVSLRRSGTTDDVKPECEGVLWSRLQRGSTVAH
jgi:hypothetical protein